MMNMVLHSLRSIFETLVNRSFLWFSLAGALMGGAFYTPYLWWAGACGLTFFLLGLQDVPSRKQAFWYGSLAGTIKTLIASSWVWAVFPLDWMGDFGAIPQIFGIGWMWITGSIAVGSSLGIFAYAIQPYLTHTFRYWIIPIAYVLSELIGSLFFSIIQYGPGGSVNIHTSFGYLGYTVAEHGILGFFAIGVGVYGLSLGIALFALFLSIHVDRCRWSVEDTRYRFQFLIVPLLILITYFFPPLFHDQEMGIRVATVNTQYENRFDLTRLEQGDRIRHTIKAFEAALGSGSDIILFPETAEALKVFGTPENVFAFIRSKTTDDLLVIDSDKLRDAIDGTSAVRAVMYDTKTNGVHSAYKKFLVPSGEYVPYQLSIMMSLLGFSETKNALGEVLEFVPGNDTEHDTQTALPAVLFCSESVSPVQSFKVAREATLPVIVHPVSHAWLNQSSMFWYQLDLMLRTQARFARLPIVQASNMASSHGYDAFGNPIQGETIYETASTSVVVYEL